MKKKTYEYQDDLPPRNHPDYGKLYREKHKELHKQQRQAKRKAIINDPVLRQEAYERDVAYRKKNRDKIIARREKSKASYMEKQWIKRGITDLTYGRFLETVKDQNNKCRVCSEELNGKKQADHDHKTGKFRGVLCTPCNMGLGVYESKHKDFERYLNETCIRNRRNIK